MQIQDSGNQDELWVIQRKINKRGAKCSWKTISPPLDYQIAVRELSRYPAETARLMTGIVEYFPINSIQREI